MPQTPNWLRRRLILPLAALTTFVCVPALTMTQAMASGPQTGAVYVALGDSYSSGEGLGPFQLGTNVAYGPEQNTCHRSWHYAYSELTKIVLPNVKSRAFWACSGATTTDMTHKPGTDRTPEQYGQPEQVLTVGSATQYITLTVGGDDVGFGPIGDSCTILDVFHGLLGGIHTFSKTSCSKQLKSSAAKLPELRKNLTALYTTLLKRSAPTSELVVAGYPRIFPTSFNGLGKVNGRAFCTLDHLRGIASVGMYVTNAKAVAAFEVNLNKAIQTAVESVAKKYRGRIEYANLYPTSVPRNCLGYTPDATVTGFELSLAGNGIGPGHLVSSATFHPTKAGQVVYAKAVEATFNELAKQRK